MTQQVLDVQFSRVVLDRPGRERVSEPVRVHLADAGSLRKASQHLLQTVRSQRDVRLQHLKMGAGEEEWSGMGAALSQVLLQGCGAAGCEWDDPLVRPQNWITSGSLPVVAMMEATEDWMPNNAATALNRSSALRRLEFERAMWTGGVVVGDVLEKHSTQVPFVQRDDVVRALSP